MSCELSTHLPHQRQISIDADNFEIGISTDKMVITNTIDLKQFDSAESEIKKIHNNPKQMEAKKIDLFQKAKLNPERVSEPILNSQLPFDAMINQFTFDQSQQLKSKRQQAIIQAESLLALQKQPTSKTLQHQKQTTNTILNNILQKTENKSRCTLQDKTKQQSGKESGHQQSFYTEEINEEVATNQAR